MSSFGRQPFFSVGRIKTSKGLVVHCSLSHYDGRFSEGFTCKRNVFLRKIGLGRAGECCHCAFRELLSSSEVKASAWEGFAGAF
jgi:hypothetical protein